jgi:hypothetical protein
MGGFIALAGHLAGAGQDVDIALLVHLPGSMIGFGYGTLDAQVLD